MKHGINELILILYYISVNNWNFARYHFGWFLSLNTKNQIQPGRGTPIQCQDYHLSITPQQIYFELCGFQERVSSCTFLEAKWGLSLTIRGTLHIVDANGVKPITITMTDKHMIKKVIHYYSLQARLNVEFLLGNTWYNNNNMSLFIYRLMKSASR